MTTLGEDPNVAQDVLSWSCTLIFLSPNLFVFLPAPAGIPGPTRIRFLALSHLPFPHK